MQPTSIDRVFVYGTLKRGEAREKCWPRRPLSVEPATVRGRLYDLGPYPALIEGAETVAGELWNFAAEDLSPTLAALDEIEGYRGREEDQYRRVVIQCRLPGGEVAAWTYLFSRLQDIARATKIPPDENGVRRWSKPDVPLHR